MTTFCYIDNSNLCIEGRRLAAVQRGLAPDIQTAMRRGIIDHTWVLDYLRLRQLLCGTDGVARIFGSQPPEEDFWNLLERLGFKTETFDRNVANKEKKVDVAIATRMMKDSYTAIDKAKDDILLVAGDSDFVPVIQALRAEGFKTEVAFWDHGARELRQVASTFFSLDAYQLHLTLSRRTVGLPEPA